MTSLVALDPSINSAGVAFFRDGVLWRCDRVTGKDYADVEDLGQRWNLVANRIAWQLRGIATCDVIVYERPQVYRGDRSEGDPNDLIGLAAIGASVAMALVSSGAAREVRTFTPAEWAKQTKKSKRASEAKTSARGLYVMSRLSKEEALLVPDQHDVIDAIGIGLHAEGRLGVRRSYSAT